MDRRQAALIALAVAFSSIACSEPSPAPLPLPTAVIRDEPPLNLGFSRPLPANWTLVSTHELLLAVPGEWSEGDGAPGVFLLHNASRDASMRIDLYGKDTIDHVVNAHYVQSNSLKPELKKLVLLNTRPSAEMRYAPLSWNSPMGGGTYEGRIIVTQLNDQSVVAFSITSDQRPREATVVSADAADRQEMIAAYAMPLRDADRTFTRSQIEHALGRAGTLSDPLAVGVSVDAVMYRVAEEAGAFVLVSLYPDRAARLIADAGAIGQGSDVPQTSLPISARAIGNAVVLVGARDVMLRYRMLVALDDLLSLPR
jgi:hypothetical protein